MTPELQAEAAKVEQDTRVAVWRLTLDNANDEPGAQTELFTGTWNQAFSRAGDMWNAHFCVVCPDRGWRLRIREVLAPVGGRRKKEKLSTIMGTIWG